MINRVLRSWRRYRRNPHRELKQLWRDLYDREPPPYWRRYPSAAEIGDAEGVTRSFVNRMMRLTLLAPDIVEAIPEGRRPKGLLLEASTGQPANWPKPKASSPACCGSPSRRCASLRR